MKELPDVYNSSARISFKQAYETAILFHLPMNKAIEALQRDPRMLAFMEATLK